MLRFSTAGESHGEALIALVQGLPAGLEVDQAFIDRELWRRQQGYGRGGRMRIESGYRPHPFRRAAWADHRGAGGDADCESRLEIFGREILPVGAGDPTKHKAVASPVQAMRTSLVLLKYNLKMRDMYWNAPRAREIDRSGSSGGVGEDAAALSQKSSDQRRVIRVGGAELEEPGHLGCDRRASRAGMRCC